MADKRLKDLPPVTATNFLDRMRENMRIMTGHTGSDAQRAEIGLGLLRGGGSALGNLLGGLGGDDGTEPDLTPPPTPSGVVVTAGITSLIFEHDPPVYTQGHGHDRTIVYGAIYSGTGPLPTFASAVEITQFQGTVYAHPTTPATEWHLWLKWKTRDGVVSAAPAGGTNGFVATTGQDVRLLLDALTKAAANPAAPYSKYAVRAGLFYIASDTGPTDAPLFSVVTAPITVNGVAVPTGVYMNDLFVMNGTITNAKIGNAAIDDAKVANMSVSKLIAGSIAVGQYAQSTGYVPGSAGWRINGDGSAEFSNVVVRNSVFAGTIFAGAGTIGGSTIGVNYMRSTNYVLNTQGWGFNADGTGQIGGFVVTNTGIQSTNYAAGVGWRFNLDGTGQIGGFQVTTGDIRSNNFVTGVDGWRITQAGGAEFSNVVVRRIVDLISGQLIPSVASTSFQGDILDTGVIDVGTGAYVASPQTNGAMRLYGPSFHSAVPFGQRVRYAPDSGYPVLITVSITAVIDAFMSVWSSANGGTWTRMATAESAGISGDGPCTISLSFAALMGSGDYIDIGVSATKPDDSFVDQGKRYLKGVTMTITCVNV